MMMFHDFTMFYDQKKQVSNVGFKWSYDCQMENCTPL